MLTKWHDTRPTRSLNKDRPFRPTLEFLEERNAPSAHGGGDGNSQGDDHGPPHPVPVTFPPAGVSNSISTGINAHGSFNGSTITGSFNTTINNTVTVNLMPGQTTAVQGLLGLTGLLSSALSNPQLGTLLTDEIIAAVDTYLTMTPVSTALGLSSSEVSILKSDLATLEGNIAGLLGTPPSPILSALGTEVFTLTLSALTSPQNTI